MSSRYIFKAMLALLASTVGFRSRFSPVKRVVFWLVSPSAAMTTIIAQLGYVFPLFPLPKRMFCTFFRSSWSFPCYGVFSKGVQLQLDGWAWNGEGVLGAKGCVGAQCSGVSNQDNFENNTMKRMPRQDWFLLVDF